LGIDLPSERQGIVPDPSWKKKAKNEGWYIGDTYNISIGQGDMLVSPLQLAAATTAIVNNGVLIKPRLLKAISDQSLEVREFTEPEIIREDISSRETLKIIKEGMYEMAHTGVGLLLADIGAEAAGKTGTAQFGREGRTHAWFTVFAPYENPEIVLTIMVEGTLEGSLVAVPIAHDVLKWYFENR
jgi:penicillin-binding protein 2